MNTVDLKKGSTEKVENYFHRISNGYKVKQQYQEIAIDKIESVLKAIDKYSPDARWILRSKFTTISAQSVPPALSCCS